jgi:hypothetical protein
MRSLNMNQLSGEIPASLGNCLQLQSLYVKHFRDGRVFELRYLGQVFIIQHTPRRIP